MTRTDAAERRPGRFSAAGVSVAEPVAALVLALPLLLNVTHFANDRPGFLIELAVCLAAGCVGRWPVAAGVATLALLTALLAVPSAAPRWAVFAILVPIVSLGARGLRKVQAALIVWFLVVVVLSDYLPPPGEAIPGPVDVLVDLSGWGFVALVGFLLGLALQAIGRDRARLVLDRSAAVQAQRRAIARDLHDTVAYATTSIVMRAEQAKLRGVDDPALLADLDYIIAAGRNSVRDLRGMMETLRRNEGADALPAPSPWRITSLNEVVRARTAELQSHGFTVTAHLEVDEESLPASVRETLAKLVVEATANMVKHGDRSAPASIMIEDAGSEVEAVFVNRARPAYAHRPDTARLGLVGARERVEALGGVVEVTSQSPSWVVRAALPLEAR